MIGVGNIPPKKIRVTNIRTLNLYNPPFLADMNFRSLRHIFVRKFFIVNKINYWYEYVDIRIIRGLTHDLSIILFPRQINGSVASHATVTPTSSSRRNIARAAREEIRGVWPWNWLPLGHWINFENISPTAVWRSFLNLCRCPITSLPVDLPTVSAVLTVLKMLY